ncbi:MAG: hypothetical protein AAF589_01900, partial [Planctomycetota bacterium]
GPAAGGVAVVITILSLLAGKYLAVEFSIQSALQEVDYELSDELMVSYLADDVVAAREAAGKPVKWPRGADGEGPDSQEDYPADIWRQAQTEWNGLTPDEQQERRDTAEENMRLFMDAFANQVRQQGFLESFSMFDLLFFGLGVFTAFSIPNNAEGD